MACKICTCRLLILFGCKKQKVKKIFTALIFTFGIANTLSQTAADQSETITVSVTVPGTCIINLNGADQGDPVDQLTATMTNGKTATFDNIEKQKNFIAFTNSATYNNDTDIENFYKGKITLTSANNSGATGSFATGLDAILKNNNAVEIPYKATLEFGKLDRFRGQSQIFRSFYGSVHLSVQGADLSSAPADIYTDTLTLTLDCT